MLRMMCGALYLLSLFVGVRKVLQLHVADLGVVIDCAVVNDSVAVIRRDRGVDLPDNQLFQDIDMAYLGAQVKAALSVIILYARVYTRLRRTEIHVRPSKT